MIYGVRDMRVRVQVYVPESEVVRGERVRESLSVEILSSPVTADPFTVHVTSCHIKWWTQYIVACESAISSSSQSRVKYGWSESWN